MRDIAEREGNSAKKVDAHIAGFYGGIFAGTGVSVGDFIAMFFFRGLGAENEE